MSLARSIPPTRLASPASLSLEERRGLAADQLRQVAGGVRSAGVPWSTGLRRIDQALGGGIPRGRLTELIGPLAVGKTALMRHTIARALATGTWVAWIDATRTLAPAPWANLGERFLVIRLPEPRRTAWVADLLLRSGVFGLVVLDGAPPLTRVQGIRLAQLTRERQAACVLLTHQTQGTPHHRRVPGALQLRLTLGRWRSGVSSGCTPRVALGLTVEKGGPLTSSKSLEVDCVIGMAGRMSTDSEVPDRRGVARSARHPWTARGTGPVDPAERTHLTEPPVTWGGIGVGAHDLYGTDVPGHPARIAAGLDPQPEPTDRFAATRDWATYRGRRRAAESPLGRRHRHTEPDPFHPAAPLG